MDKKLIVAVIGLCMGEHHASAVLEHKEAKLAAICDLDLEKLEQVGNKLNIPKENRYTKWQDLLKVEGLNAVIVATPDQLHREMSETFLKAGIHVMCEKPLALSREDISSMIHTAKEANVKFMVGQICRFTPAFVKAKELIDHGTIGDVYFVESEYAHDYAKILSAWRADPKRHGVVGGGCHAVDLLRWFAGDPEEVFAYGSHKLLPQVPYDDATIAVLKFPVGIIGKVFVSTGCKRPYTMRTLIYGTKGTILCDNTSEYMELYTLGEDGISAKPEPEIIPVDINNHNTVREFAVFAEHILRDTVVQMDADQGARTIAVCMAIVESSQTGKAVAPDYGF